MKNVKLNTVVAVNTLEDAQLYVVNKINVEEQTVKLYYRYGQGKASGGWIHMSLLLKPTYEQLLHSVTDGLTVEEKEK